MQTQTKSILSKAAIRLVVLSLSLSALAACGNSSPTQPPTDPPITPPTTPVTPPTTPPTMPPIVPTPPTTPPTTPTDPPVTNVPYGGTWAWVVAFEDETTIFGGLAITQLESDPAVFTDSGEGPYAECQGESCPDQPDGVGVIGTYTADDGSSYLSAAFFEAALQGAARLVATDADNQLGTELQGQETFLGAGVYYGDDGSASNVSVGIVRVPASASVGAAQKRLEGLLVSRKNELERTRVLGPTQLQHR